MSKVILKKLNIIIYNSNKKNYYCILRIKILKILYHAMIQRIQFYQQLIKQEFDIEEVGKIGIPYTIDKIGIRYTVDKEVYLISKYY